VDALNLKCGQCGHINELPANWRQPVAFCVMCGHKITVPRPEEATADAVEDLPGDDEAGFADQARKSEGRKIILVCPKCGKTVTVSARVAGRKARCKACDGPMDIPYPDDVEHPELPRPRNDAKETGLDLVAPGEMPASARASVPPDDRESMLDLLPEPIQYASDDEGTHEPLPVVIPLSQQADTARPQHLPHKRRANGHRPEPQAVPDAAAAMQAAIEAQPQPELETSPNLAGLAEALPPAAQVPSQEAGELASAVKDFKAGKEAVMARRRKAARVRSMVYLAVGTVLCSVLIGLAVMFWPTLFPERPNSTEIARNSSRPGQVGPKQGLGSQTTTTQVVAPVVPVPVTKGGPGPAVPPAAPQPRCDIVALVTTTLGPGGYYPAPLGSIYWKMTAEIKAGTDSIAFNAKGKDVQLAFAGKTVDSLGIAENPSGGQGPLPRLARQEAVSIKPGLSRKVTLLFEVPVGTSQGEVVIGKLRWPFTVKPGGEPIDPARLAGTFVEAAPRNLQPMLADPVMSAIQSAGWQELDVRPNGSGLEVEIPQAQVYGRATPAGPDVYGVGLACGEHKLAANLRFVDGGRTAILYLADKPFHQITYVSQTAPSPPPPKPAAPAASKPAESQPTTAEKPADTPPAETTKSRRGPRTVTMPKGPPERDKDTDLPRGKSIFD
jgi:DNA-directed RNA polymerase subunit RPC12/RpoP